MQQKSDGDDPIAGLKRAGGVFRVKQKTFPRKRLAGNIYVATGHSGLLQANPGR